MGKVKQYLDLIFCIDNSETQDLGKDNYELALKIALEELQYYKEKNIHSKPMEYDSTKLISIDECKMRFEAKNERLKESPWRCWYNGWLDGRADMLQDIFYLKSELNNQNQ